MSPNKQLVHSAIWTFAAVLSTSTVLACKDRERDKAPADDERVQREQPPSATAEQAKATEPATEPATQTTTVVEAVVPLVDEKVIAAARDLAGAMEAASTALDGGDRSKAEAELGKAESALAEVEANRPSVALLVQLWRKQQELGVADTASGVDTIPLFVTVSRVEVPVYNREQIQAQHEKRQAQARESISAEEKLSDLRLVDSNLVYFEIDLPLAASWLAVLEAQRLLGENKPAEAKVALRRGLESARAVEAIVEAPEFRARRFIWEAETAFGQGKRDEAKQLLAKAHELLAPMLEQSDDPGAKVMITTMVAQMRPLQESTATGPGTDEEASAFRRISRDALNLARRAAMRVDLARHQQQQHYALVDALTWLESARIAGALQPESTTVMRDLQGAREALTQAAQVAPSSAKGKFDELRKRLDAVVELDRATPRDSTRIDSELANVIFDLRMLTLDLRALPPEVPRAAE
jgi:hypothetical protein